MDSVCCLFTRTYQFTGRTFANPNAQKSILLLQRQGGDSKQAVKVLLGEFPSFKDKAKFASFMDDISKWVTTNLR